MRRIDGLLLDVEDARALLPALSAGMSALASRGALRADTRAAAQAIASLAMAAAAAELPSARKFAGTSTEVEPASACVRVEELARRAGTTEARVRQYLRQLEERSGCRLPRAGRRFQPVPASVAADFLAQVRGRHE